MDTRHQQGRDKLSIGISLFIAICVISLFCAISIAIAKNIDTMAQNQQIKYFPLPTDNDPNRFIF